MKLTRSILTATALLALSLTTAGCGDDDDSPGAVNSPQTNPAPTSVQVAQSCTYQITDNLGIDLTEITPQDAEANQLRAILVFDTINICTDDGACTEAAPPATEVTLTRQTTDSNGLPSYKITEVAPTDVNGDPYEVSDELRGFQRNAVILREANGSLTILWDGQRYPMQCQMQ